MRVVPIEEFRRLLAYALRRLPGKMRPENVEAAALLLTDKPPLDRLEFRIRAAPDHGKPPDR